MVFFFYFLICLCEGKLTTIYILHMSELWAKRRKMLVIKNLLAKRKLFTEGTLVDSNDCNNNNNNNKSYY